MAQLESNTDSGISPTPGEVAGIFTVVLLFIAGLIFLGIAQNAADSDWAADRVTHENCKVTDKQASAMRSGSKFEVQTTCGDYETHAELWDQVEAGKTYSLMTTPGNWAHSAYLLRADLNN